MYAGKIIESEKHKEKKEEGKDYTMKMYNKNEESRYSIEGDQIGNIARFVQHMPKENIIKERKINFWEGKLIFSANLKKNQISAQNMVYETFLIDSFPVNLLINVQPISYGQQLSIDYGRK